MVSQEVRNVIVQAHLWQVSTYLDLMFLLRYSGGIQTPMDQLIGVSIREITGSPNNVPSTHSPEIWQLFLAEERKNMEYMYGGTEGRLWWKGAKDVSWIMINKGYLSSMVERC